MCILGKGGWKKVKTGVFPHRNRLHSRIESFWKNCVRPPPLGDLRCCRVELNVTPLTSDSRLEKTWRDKRDEREKKEPATSGPGMYIRQRRPQIDLQKTKRADL